MKLRKLARLEVLALERLEDIDVLLNEVSQIKDATERHLTHIRLANKLMNEFADALIRETP